MKDELTMTIVMELGGEQVKIKCSDVRCRILREIGWFLVQIGARMMYRNREWEGIDEE